MEMVSISRITIGERFRKRYRTIEELADSFKKFGILQPIIISDDFKLVAGGRRLEAAKKAGLDKVPVIFRANISELEFREIELEENLQRDDLHWTEEIAAVKALDKLKRKLYGDGSREEEGWSLKDTAEVLGESIGGVSEDIALADAVEYIPQLADARNKSEAKKVFKQLCEKAAQKKIVESARASKMTNPAFRMADKHYIIGDALERLRGLDSNSPIGLIEIDPPYAVDLKKLREKHREKEGSGKSVESYNEIDIKDYPQFLLTVLKECRRIAGLHCYLIIWHASIHQHIVSETIRAAGLEFDKVPCIWYKDEAGITMRPKRLLARSYEPFFVAWKGDPLLVRQGRGNVFVYKPEPNPYHPTQKPLGLMEDIVRTFSLPATIGLVPFLGSGATLRALYRNGASGFGYELSEVYKTAFLSVVLQDKEEMKG